MSENLQHQQPPQPTPPGSTPGLSTTPDSSKKRARARPTVSCLECRRKKLKCDRVQPCTQCNKRGRGALCTYASGIHPSGIPETQDESRKRVKVGQAVVENGNVSVASRDLTGSVDHTQSYSLRDLNEGRTSYSDVPARSLGRIDVKGNRSKYLGLGDQMAILDHFEGAKSFIINSFKDLEMVAMMNELSAFHRSSHSKAPKVQFPPPQSRSILISEMLDSLPSEAFAGIPEALYFSTWESTLRILPYRSFTAEFSELFTNLKARPGVLPPDTRESLIPQTLAVIGLGVRQINEPYTSERFPDEQISRYCDMIHRWLDALSGKEKLNIHTLRTQILLLILRQANLLPASDLWKESGNVVRSAMILGLHQDPEDCGDFSKLEKEHRRKLWRTVVELDIQFALAVGMPTAIRSADFNSKPLKNVDDYELEGDIEKYPEDKPPHVWTQASPQIVLEASIQKRLDATNLIGGNVYLGRDVQEILNLAGDLERHIHSLPTPFRSDTQCGRNDDKATYKLWTQIMLDVYLRRSSLNLYRTIALSDQGSRYPEARKAAVRSSIAMLSHLDALDPTVADLNTIQTRDWLNLFHVLCKNDIIQAALMLCLEIRSFNSSSNNETSTRLHAFPGESVQWTKHSLTRIVENTLNSLIQRLGQFGSDLKAVLPLSIVLQSVRSDGTLEQKRELMIRGADRILKACREVLPGIKDAAVQIRNSQAGDAAPAAGSQSPFNVANWNSVTEPPTQGLNGVPHILGDFNLIPGDDLNFPMLDFGFSDWDIGQSWL